MKKFLIIALSAVFLVMPFSGAFAEGSGSEGSFVDDIGRLRRDLEDAEPIVTGYNFTYNDIARVTGYCVEASIDATDGAYPYYFALPIFDHYNTGDVVDGFRVFVFMAKTDSFFVTLEFPHDDLTNTFLSVSCPSDAVICYFSLSKYFLTGDIRPGSPSIYSYGTNFFNLYSRFSLIIGATDGKFYRNIDSIDYLTLQSISRAHVGYIPFGSTEPDPDVQDFFSQPSLGVILSTGGRYLWHRFSKTAMILTLCGVGLAASLIGLELLPKVFRRFGIV